jgi:hypothetical protein
MISAKRALMKSEGGEQRNLLAVKKTIERKKQNNI